MRSTDPTDTSYATTTRRIGDVTAVDALMRRVRWVGAVFCIVQFAMYTNTAAATMPFPRTVGVLVTVPLLLLNVVGLLAGARAAQRWPRGWPLAQLVVDSGVIVAIVWLFSFDAYNALWALMVLPVLMASLRFQRRGAFLTWAAVAVIYVARDAWAAHVYDLRFYIDSVSYRLGVVAIVAAAAGGLADRLHATAARLAAQVAAYRQSLAEADGLRVVATSARRIASLDASTVLDEVAAAAREIGFSDAHVALLETPSPGDDRLALACREHPVVLDGDAVPGWPGATAPAAAVVAGVSAGDELVALLVAGHAGPVPARQVEALELLAAQAGSSLLNARRYSERRAFEHRLTHQATHDALTGLPNRTLLRDRMQQAVAAAARHGTQAAVLLLDLDRFKEINDTLGHSYGDGLLRQVGERLARTLRETDTAARLGGDEFAVLATNLTDAGAPREVAERVLAALHDPYVVDDVVLDVEASIGVAVAPAHGHDVDELLRAADVAMYAAKGASAGIAEYDAAQDEHTYERLVLLGELRRALEDPDQLVLHYQPKVDVARGEVVGVEALLRWQHPTRGIVPPGDFIPVAEGTGLIHRLSTRVLDLALQQVRAWSDAGHALPVAVNISSRCLHDQSLPDVVLELLERHGVGPAMLRLEITESAMMSDPTRALGVLCRLHDAGVSLSIDDFGTGYSSMSYLKRLPVDELKIDRSFVIDMDQQSDATLVRTVVELGHNLGLHVVAEGVETEQALAALSEFGCDVAQGYHLARPMPAAALVDWLARGPAGAPVA